MKPSQPAAAKEKKKNSIVAVICSDGRGGESQRMRMRTFSCQKAFGQTEEIHFPSGYSEGRIAQEAGGAKWTVRKLRVGSVS